MGGDWWLNLHTGWLPDWSANSGIGNGRSKWVTTDWQSFNMCTLMPEQISATPPISGNDISLPGLSISKFMIYPNPLMNGNLFIRSEELSSEADLTIYAAQGKLIYSGIIKQSETIQIAKSFFNCGLYLIKVSNQGFSGTKRLVVE